MLREDLTVDRHGPHGDDGDCNYHGTHGINLAGRRQALEYEFYVRSLTHPPPQFTTSRGCQDTEPVAFEG